MFEIGVGLCSSLPKLIRVVGFRASGLARPRLYHSQSCSKFRSCSFAMAINVGGMRKEYPGVNASFDVCDLAAREPVGQFRAWFDAARACPDVEEPNAMCLATADAAGIPSARIVLMKEFGPEGFVFYTNYESRKGQELQANPNAALVFYWEPFKRSVRVEGRVEKVSVGKSAEYFDSRPVGSQIGAAVSRQSKAIKNRAVLTDREAELRAEYMTEDGQKVEGKKLPKPESWGGFILVPNAVEFWQGRSSRLHDRLRFRRRRDSDGKEGEDGEHVYVEGHDGWVIERLAP